MVFLNYKEMPWTWFGFDWFPYAMLMAVLVPGLLSPPCSAGSRSRSRVTGVYLSIITQALTYALLLAFFRNDMGFGGNNGLTDFKELLGAPLSADLHPLRPAGRHPRPPSRHSMCMARWLTRSRFGKVS